MSWRKIKQGKGIRSVYMGAILSRMARESLVEKLAFKQRPEGGVRGRHASVWGESIPGGGNRAEAQGRNVPSVSPEATRRPVG